MQHHLVLLICSQCILTSLSNEQCARESIELSSLVLVYHEVFIDATHRFITGCVGTDQAPRHHPCRSLNTVEQSMSITLFEVEGANGSLAVLVVVSFNTLA